MKTFVIAQHHGVFLTLESLLDNNIDDIVVIIPNSQVEKYNKMYNENSTNPEFKIFKDYDKLISQYIKSKNVDIQAYVYDDFDIKNTVVSTLNFIAALGTQEIVACILSGSVAVKDYTQFAKNSIDFKEFAACYTRVYENHPQLSMYHMIGLNRQDKSLDVNFFIVDMTKIKDSQLNVTDSTLLNDMSKRKQVTILPRDYNGRDDVLIGNAISARQTIVHNLKIQHGFIANLWNKACKPSEVLKSEEIYGYPFHIYSKYTKKIYGYLPQSTANRIILNGEETAKCTGGLYECLDIIDL